MPPETEKLLAVGEIIPFERGDETVDSTLIEIIQLPVEPEQRGSLIKTTMQRFSNNENIALMPGDNLSDDPKFVQRVDINVLYVFEYAT